MIDKENVVESVGILDKVKKVVNSITIEPFIICWLIPYFFTSGKFN